MQGRIIIDMRLPSRNNEGGQNGRCRTPRRQIISFFAVPQRSYRHISRSVIISRRVRSAIPIIRHILLRCYLFAI